MTLVRTLSFTADGSVDLPKYQTFAEQIELLNPTVWTPQRTADFTSLVGAEVQTLAARDPDTAVWTAIGATRRPTKQADNTLLFDPTAPAEGLALSGASVNPNAYSKLAIFKIDPTLATTGHILTSAASGATRHSLNYSNSFGGQIVANSGTGTEKQVAVAVTKDQWTWAMSAYSGDEQTVFLETAEQDRVQATWNTGAVAVETTCYMGTGTSGGSGTFRGLIGPTLILPTCLFSIDAEDDAALAPTRAMLRRYAERVIQRLNAA